MGHSMAGITPSPTRKYSAAITVSSPLTPLLPVLTAASLTRPSCRCAAVQPILWFREHCYLQFWNRAQSHRISVPPMHRENTRATPWPLRSVNILSNNGHRCQDAETLRVPVEALRHDVRGAGKMPCRSSSPCLGIYGVTTPGRATAVMHNVAGTISTAGSSTSASTQRV